MGNYTNLKNLIDQYITTNGQGDITGAILNSTLKNMVDSIAAGFIFAGVATPDTVPGSPDQNVFFITGTPGTYTNFNSLVIPNGISIIKYTGSWSSDLIVDPNQSIVYGTIQGYINTTNGIITSTQYQRTSEMFMVYEGLKLTTYARIQSTQLIVAYYDINGNYLASISPSDPQADASVYAFRELTVPAGAFFCRYNSAYDSGTTSYCTMSIDYSKLVNQLLEYLSVSTQGVTVIPKKNGYINKTDGQPVTNQYWRYSDFFPVVPGAILTTYNRVGNGNLLIAFYDQNRGFLASVSPTSTLTANTYEVNNITVPSSAYYAVFHSANDAGTTPFCRVKQGSILECAARMTDNLVSEYTFKNTVKKPLNFSGKTIVFFGDSITYGVASCPPSSTYPYGLISPCTNPYAKLLCANLGITYNSANNKAISGSRFAGTYQSTQSITTTILNFSGAADIIYIAGGCNDYASGVAIGTPSDNTQDTLYGALNLICARLKSNYPNAIVFFALPINISAEYNNSIPLNQYREVIYEVAVANGYYVVDGSRVGFPSKTTLKASPNFKATMIYDGVHPTELGHVMMADVIASLIL